MTACLYLYKSLGNDSELRYSLRSLRYLEGAGEVWLVGDCPGWLTDVGHIPGGAPGANKFGTLFADLLLACRSPELPAEFVLMNDDFHFLAPFTAAVEHGGSLAARIEAGKPGQFTEHLLSTYRWLEGHGYEDPLIYDVHRPLPMVKERVAEVLEQAIGWNANEPVGGRTLYGVCCGIGGEQVPDRKLNFDRKGDDWRERSFVSTSDDAWIATKIGGWLRARSPEPSRWEADA